MNVSIHIKQPWDSFKLNEMHIHYCGVSQAVQTIADAAEKKDLMRLKRTLRDSFGHFSCIVQGDDFVFACVDNCRTTPVFYSDYLISNSAEIIRDSLGTALFNEPAVLEVAMAGYTTGSDTVIKGLNQLQAGEFLFWENDALAPTIDLYYEFIPDKLVTIDEPELVRQIAELFDNVMQRIIKQVNGRTVWVPLSGGLDSRLILSKLVELKCPNVKAFSYGPAGNDEARSAKNVAEILGVPWHFVPSTKKAMRKLFASYNYEKFWQHANGLDGVPNFQDLLPLSDLLEQGIVQKGDIVINGQSGDFITGGHIPAQFLKALPVGETMTRDDLFNAIIKKHFSLWNALKTPENLSIIKSRILASLPSANNDEITSHELVAAYEYSEYKERQAKFVVSGQRVYDVLGLDWFLPLWDPEFVEIWRNIPPEKKAGQKLFKQYLLFYNYKNLFSEFKPCLDGWPGISKAVLPFARLIRWTMGIESRDKYLKSMAVFGMYGYLYAPYPFWKTIFESQKFRNPIALFTRTWLIENKIPLPKALK